MFSRNKIQILLLSVIISLLMVCNKQSNEPSGPAEATGMFNDPIRDDLNDYIINNMRPITETMDSAMNDFSNFSGSPDAYGGLLTSIEGDVIPKFSQIVKKLENVKPKTTEVKKTHDIFTLATKDMLAALNLMKKGLKNENPDMLEEANRKIERAGNDIETYKTNLRALCRAHGVENLLSDE